MESWISGLSLTALTMAIHATGIAFMGFTIRSITSRLETRAHSLIGASVILIGAIGINGLLLAVLHGVEAAVWAEAYLLLGAFNSPGDALLYSLDSMTTRGAAGLALQRHWRMMGALEASDGMLLFGISTAFLFAVMQRGLAKLTGGLIHAVGRHGVNRAETLHQLNRRSSLHRSQGRLETKL
jgi:hypothetical protein